MDEEEQLRSRRETLSHLPLDPEAESGRGSQALHPRPLPQEPDSGEPRISIVYLTFNVLPLQGPNWHSYCANWKATQAESEGSWGAGG